MSHDDRFPDDDDLDQALGCLGIPPAATPMASAEDLLTRIRPSPPMGSSRALLGKAVAGALLLGGLGGWWVHGRLNGSEPVIPIVETSASPTSASQSPTKPRSVEVPPIPPSVRTEGRIDTVPSMESRTAHRAVVPRLPPRSEAMPSTRGAPEAAPTPPLEIASGQPDGLPPIIASLLEESETTTPTADKEKPRDDLVSTPPLVASTQHLPSTTLTAQLGSTGGRGAWKAIEAGRATSAGATLTLLTGGTRPLRPLLGSSADTFLYLLDDGTRAGGDISVFAGFGASGDRLRFEMAWMVGARWLGARKGVESPLDPEAGWLYLESGPRLEARLGRPHKTGLRVGVALPFAFLDIETIGSPKAEPWLDLHVGVDFPLHVLRSSALSDRR